MPSFVPHVLIGVGITIAIWALGGADWPAVVIGAVLAAALFLMLWLGPVEPGEPRRVPATRYLATGVVGVALGYVFYRLGDENGVWWSVGFILAGVALPVGTAATRGSDRT